MRLVEEPIENYIIHLARAPLDNPEIVPTVLPLVLGLLVLELYFGKYTNEKLGWNSSVANSVIWISTGATLYIAETLGTAEKWAVYFLIGIGSLTAYLDFFHKWPEEIAFIASSAPSVYILAYITTVMVRTGIPVTRSSLIAAGIFLIGATAFFKLLQALETPAKNQLRM